MVGIRGVALSVVARAARLAFNPASLFAASEPGVWYDPSDLSTLFQDSAGTTPVTAVEQPVGLMLDKSRGLVRGPELVTNGTFDTDLNGWANISLSWIWSSGKAIASTPGTAGDLLLDAGGVVGKMYEASFTISDAIGQGVYISIAGNDIAYFGNGTFKRVVSCTATSKFFRASKFSADGGSIDNISVRELPGNHAFQATAVDRPILRQDAGGRYYLAANGVNTWMQTNSIDFTATDKVTVFAGVRKLSDAALGMVLETSSDASAQNGAFSVRAPRAAGTASVQFLSRGTAFAASQSDAFAAPVSAVLSGAGDISGDRAILRINGAQVAQNTADQGAGNFGNYPLFLFRRGGSAFPFNGHFYGALIRGALCTDPQILAMERWLALRTGVTI